MCLLSNRLKCIYIHCGFQSVSTDEQIDRQMMEDTNTKSLGVVCLPEDLQVNSELIEEWL